jgi:hypothetical protein
MTVAPEAAGKCRSRFAAAYPKIVVKILDSPWQAYEIIARGVGGAFVVASLLIARRRKRRMSARR